MSNVQGRVGLAPWLPGYRKPQLAHLAGHLRPASTEAAMQRKKSALVDELAGVFAQAANDPQGCADAEFVQRVNAWVPQAVRGESASDT